MNCQVNFLAEYILVLTLMALDYKIVTELNQLNNGTYISTSTMMARMLSYLPIIFMAALLSNRNWADRFQVTLIIICGVGASFVQVASFMITYN